MRAAGGSGVHGGQGHKVEVLTADFQEKPDIGAAIARQWFDQDGVDAIVDLTNSAVALAVSNVAREKNKVNLPNRGRSIGGDRQAVQPEYRALDL